MPRVEGLRVLGFRGLEVERLAPNIGSYTTCGVERSILPSRFQPLGSNAELGAWELNAFRARGLSHETVAALKPPREASLGTRQRSQQ